MAHRLHCVCVCVCVRACVCVCVPRYHFQTCSNCEVQNLYVLLPLQTMCLKVHALQVGHPKGQSCYLLYEHRAANAPLYRSPHPIPCISEGEEGVLGAGSLPAVHAEKCRKEESYLLDPRHKRGGMELVIFPLRP